MTIIHIHVCSLNFLHIEALRPSSSVTEGSTGQGGFVNGPGLCRYLEGHGDLLSRLIKGIISVIIWAIGVLKLLTKSP